MLAAVLLIAADFFSCGVERQDVKVLRDPGAMKLKGPVRATVEQLVALRRPGRTRGRAQIERVVASVEGTVLEVKNEADGDLHVMFAGANGMTMIAELPSPACTYGSPYAPSMTRAREDFLRVTSAFGGRPARRLRFTGVVFFDREHGQTLGAMNGVELHPVLKVEAVGK